MKISCPQEKLGKVIGKRGKNVKQLADAAKVTVDINKQDVSGGSGGNGQLHIIGSMSSLDQAMSDLQRVISKVEEKVPVEVKVVEYWTAKGIHVLTDLRTCHPDVYVDVDKSRTDYIVLRGIPADIESAKEDLFATEIVEHEWQVSAKEGSLVIGKQGTTIEGLVVSHQTAIDVKRGSSSIGETISTIRVVGPSGHVEGAVREIQSLLNANREIELKVPINPYIKSTMLLESGKGIQALGHKVNDAIKSEGVGHVSLNFETDQQQEAITIKGKTRVLDEVEEIVQAEIRRLEHLMTRIQVDPLIIPVLIGKGGQSVKTLKRDRVVNVEFDPNGEEVIVCGLKENDVRMVVEDIQAMASKHRVVRIDLDSALYKTQIRDLFRQKSKEINALVHMVTDDEKAQVVLRGSEENLTKASDLVKDFVAKNNFQELDVTEDDMSALLVGGKASKIVEFAAENGVKLHSDRVHQKIEARGEKEKVTSAIKAIRRFLYGGEGISMSKITLSSDDVRTVIGRGGKTKADLQKRFSDLSIIAHRNENVITLRGPEHDVETCRLEILKIVATSRITNVIDLPTEQLKQIEKSKFHRKIMQSVPVVITVEEDSLIVRGVRDEVRYATALLHEHVGRPYEVGYFLEASLYQKVRDSWGDQSGLKRIEELTNTVIKLDDEQSAIIFCGKKDSVRKAKTETLKFIDFLFESRFCRMDVSGVVLASLSKAGAVAELATTSGVQAFLDRDINAIVILSSDPKRVLVAKEGFQAKISSEANKVYVLQLDKSEDWIVSTILGKNGNRIKSLRKETGCKIDVDSREHRVTVTADKEDLVTNATHKIDEIVSNARKECAFLSIPQKEMPAFVGKSGKNIKEFEKEHEVECQILKQGSANIRISGKEEAVLSSKAALAQWIFARDEKHREEQGTVTIALKKEQVPTLIGEKGSVIRAIEREFGCKIDVNRQTFVVVIRGAKRQQTLEKIVKIVTETPEEVKDAGGDGHSNSTRKKDFTKKVPHEKTKTKPSLVKYEPTNQKTVAGAPIQVADFPVLSQSSDGQGEANRSAGTSSGPSWVSVLHTKAPTIS